MGARRDEESRPGRLEQGSASRTSLLVIALTALAFALLLGLVEARWEPLRALDRSVALSLHEVALDHPAVVTVMQVASDVGAPRTFWVVLPALALYLLLRRRPADALFVIVTGAGGGLLNRAIKELVGRARPDLPDPVSQAAGEAFPSGHALGTAVGVGVLLIVLLPRKAGRWRRVAVALGALLVLGVGLSRIVLGVHWVSDVVGAWLLSTAWLLAMVAVFGRRSRSAEPDGVERDTNEAVNTR